MLFHRDVHIRALRFALFVPFLAGFLGAALPASATTPAPGSAPGARPVELLVRLTKAAREPRLGATELRDFDRICRELGAESLRPLVPPNAHRRDPAAFHALGLDRVVRLRLPEGAVGAAAVARLASSRDVELAYEPGFATAANTPNDPQYGNQWGLGTKFLVATKAWDVVTDATGVPIAVLDSGADLQHNDFRANRWVNTGEVLGNSIDDDGNGYVDDRFGYDFVNQDGDPDDDNGHGTQVTGILGAVGNNVLDAVGICWSAQVISCKVLDSGNSGALADIAEAVTYAADNGALVANMSFVTSIDDPTLHAAIDYARTVDVVQVAAAGNNGDEVLLYPAAYDGVLAVIASDDKDKRWTSSTFGDWCDLAAPGVAILSLKNGGGTTTQTGTSFAAPFVAGVAALVRKVNPDLDETAVGLTISYSCDDLGPAGFDKETGWGRLDAERALALAVTLTADATVVDDGSSIDLHLAQPGDDGFLYLLLPSTTGRVPGLAIAGFDPADARFLPLNDDWLQGWVITTSNNPLFQHFVDYLDPNGDATATFLVPKHLWEGVDFDFAYVTLDPADLAHIAHLSEPFRIHVR